ncbi:hypothetical protein H8D30_02690 [bacterium]|nr:hypothetical protein [bacterium]
MDIDWKAVLVVAIVGGLVLAGVLFFINKGKSDPAPRQFGLVYHQEWVA